MGKTNPVKWSKRPENRERIRAYWRKYYKSHPGKSGEMRRIQRYGIDKEMVGLLTKAQNGQCAICGSIPKRLVIDHDHETTKVRAMLCDKCNMGLGYFGDNPNTLASAVKYVLFWCSVKEQFPEADIVVRQWQKHQNHFI